MLQIAILIDDAPNPIEIQLDPADIKKHIQHPRGGVAANFEHQPSLSDEKVLIYKRSNCKLSNEEFESVAHKYADPYRRPEVYRKINRETVVGNVVTA